MSRPLEQPFLCPIIVGREQELAALTRFLGGPGQPVLLIGGEAGIGKSRLVAEAMRRALDQGRRVLAASCFEPDQSIPFAPLRDLLRRYRASRSGADLLLEFGPDAGILVRLLPEVSAALPDVAASVAAGPAPEKHHLFETLTRFLTRLAAEQALLFIVEDLHWSDDVSLEFVRYAARRLVEADVRIVLTYRADEASGELDHCLAELQRERLAGELTLRRLTSDELDKMVRAILGWEQPTPRAVLDFLRTWTEGTPFLVEELLQSLVSTGVLSPDGGSLTVELPRAVQVPRGVHDTVRRRSDLLSPAARRLLSAAAVAGRRVDFELLRALVEPDEQILLDRMKELIAAQLVVEESADRFAFRHVLIQQAVYADLLARERRLLHRDIAETLERLSAGVPDQYLAERARHSYQAGLWQKVLDYSRRLGEQAQTLAAPREAIEHFTHALEAAERLSYPPPATILQARGSAYEMVGDLARAQADLERALEVSREGGAKHAEWQCLTALGFFWLSSDYLRAGTYLRAAHDLALELADPVIVAHSLNRLGNWHLNREEPDEARRRHQEALAIFQRVDDRSGIAETLDFLAMTNLLAGDLIQCAADAERAAALFEKLGNLTGRISSLATLTFCGGSHSSALDVPAGAGAADFLRAGEPALALARAVGWQSAEAYILAVRAHCLGHLGRYGPALDLGERARTIADAIGHSAWSIIARCTLATIALDLCDAAKALEESEEARNLAQTIGSLHWIRYSTGIYGSALVVSGECDRAEAALNQALDPAAPARTMGQRRIWSARLELALARGDRDSVAIARDRLLSDLAHPDQIGDAPVLLYLKGQSECALDQIEAAEESFRSTCAAANRQGVRSVLWRSQIALARLYQQRGRVHEAEVEFIAARAVLAGLAAGLTRAGQRDEFLRRTERLFADPDASLTARVPRPAPGGLTAREWDVAIRLTRGLSNRRIAEELVIGERTVETHVANILGKLGFTSRAQVAAWVAERGLAGSD